MVEEINVKAIQKQKANAEKAKKANESKAQKEELQQENKLLKIKKNTVMNKTATRGTPAVDSKKEFVEYKDAFILSYFEVIAKSCSKYISNCDEITLKKRGKREERRRTRLESTGLKTEFLPQEKLDFRKPRILKISIRLINLSWIA